MSQIPVTTFCLTKSMDFKRYNFDSLLILSCLPVFIIKITDNTEKATLHSNMPFPECGQDHSSVIR